MSTVAITVEGVMRKMISGARIPEGIDLYYGLATRAKIILLTDAFENDGELQYWLKVEGIHEHIEIMWSDRVVNDLSTVLRRCRQCNQYQGGSVSLVVDPNPAVTAHLVSQGYNTLTFTHAEYSTPEWRPDYEHEVRPWSELSQQVAHEAFLRATDKRNDDEEVSRRAG